ncbi:MAG: hypothetical protein AAF449_21060, partial [Myxococcota bacterium]
EHRVRATFRAGDTSIAFRLTTEGAPGIHYGIRAHTAAGALWFEGVYAPGHPWRFSPVRLDDREYAAAPTDAHEPWFAANDACVAAMVACFRGERRWEAGLREGLFDAQRAAQLEDAVVSIKRNPVP